MNAKSFISKYHNPICICIGAGLSVASSFASAAVAAKADSRLFASDKETIAESYTEMLNTVTDWDFHDPKDSGIIEVPDFKTFFKAHIKDTMYYNPKHTIGLVFGKEYNKSAVADVISEYVASRNNFAEVCVTTLIEANKNMDKEKQEKVLAICHKMDNTPALNAEKRTEFLQKEAQLSVYSFAITAVKKTSEILVSIAIDNMLRSFITTAVLSKCEELLETDDICETISEMVTEELSEIPVANIAELEA